MTEEITEDIQVREKTIRRGADYDNLAPPPMPRHPVLEAFRQAQYGSLLLSTPDRHTYFFGGRHPGPEAYLKLHRWDALDGLLARGEIGFAEGYMDGLWDSHDLPALLTFGLLNADALERYFYGKPWYALWVRFKNLFHRNSISGSRRNITAHYDLGNEFYSLWLDEGMTYSCALFKGNASLSLEEAQVAKYRRILDKLGARPGQHILEIGCGWGGFAEAAARHGIRVTAVTISDAQKAYAESRMRRQGLEDMVTIALQDYRKVEGQFDYIVSIGMFEHVGQQYWQGYFDTVRARLKPGGKAMVQSITIDEDVFQRTQGQRGFIEHYIFQGGELPPKSRFRTAAEQAGLECNELFSFGRDYALTTRRWLERFDRKHAQVRDMGYDARFIRMWRFYLSCCIAAFTTGRTDVMQAELRVP